MKLALNISLVPEIQQSPHILTNDLGKLCTEVKELGYDGVELFPKDAKSLSRLELKNLVVSKGLEICAFGTGAGKVLKGLTLTDPNPEIRRKAVQYISEILKVARYFGSGVIIGSMQGNIVEGLSKGFARQWFVDSLEMLSKEADHYGINILIEPINRYESNFINTLEQGADIIKDIGRSNIKLLADMFHMNIEEVSIESSIRQVGQYIGHIHYADSNRLYPGLGHTDFNKLFNALKEIGYNKYLSTEAFVTELETDMSSAMLVYSEFKNKLVH